MFQFLTVLVAAFSLVSFIQAKPATSLDNAKLTLPWGTYVAEPYGNGGSVSFRIVEIQG